MNCYVCDAKIMSATGSQSAKVGGQWSWLCPACWAKVQRGGRTPRQTIEAILYFYNDPEVGGPGDPLDHEDYRDLERLGLWPEGGDA